MKVELNKFERLEEIAIGECFLLGNHLYLRTDYTKTIDDEGKWFKCVDLETGSLEEINQYEQVSRINVKVVNE